MFLTVFVMADELAVQRVFVSVVWFPRQYNTAVGPQRRFVLPRKRQHQPLKQIRGVLRVFPCAQRSKTHFYTSAPNRGYPK